MALIREFYGYAKNGRPAHNLADIMVNRTDITGYSIEFGPLDAAETPSRSDTCTGGTIMIRLTDGLSFGPLPVIIDNRPGRGYVFIVSELGTPT